MFSVFKGITIAKLKDHGFWGSQQFYWQSLMHYFYYSAKFRSITFFAATNPAISLGGMLDDTKTEIYALLPKNIVPQTLVYRKGEDLHTLLQNSEMTFPLICKPDIGYKGHNVVKMENQDALKEFLDSQQGETDWLIQEYVDYKKEYSLLYYHRPLSQQTGITSLIEKIYPFVTGDGSSTLRQLIDQYKNIYLKRDWVLKKWEDKLDMVPDKDDEIILDYIGNYSRGAKFYSRMDSNDEALVKMADAYFQNIEGMYFFRADLKADSMEALKKGAFKILEINGAKSEPLHLYDPKYGFWGRWKIIRDHWKHLQIVVLEVCKKENFRFPDSKKGFDALASIKEKVK